MYYWRIAYTFAVRGTRPGVAEYDKIETLEDTYVASNFIAAMEQFTTSIKLRLSENITVCDIAVVRGNVARVL